MIELVTDKLFFLVIDYSIWIKIIHIISFTCWMAGMLYLPRLFVYHSQVKIKSESSELFKIMEKNLLRYIINPAMFITIITGALLYWTLSVQTNWFLLKILCVLGLISCHAFFSYHVKQFAIDNRSISEKAWRFLNEIPTVLLIIIIILVIRKPF
ncbi:CopD family protein [Bartonella sp. DGB1]|uniref:CopD family protein n=1 Tax=Bartonella sp. DGB1 TaxID=3239807 RepID=UPI003523D194